MTADFTHLDEHGRAVMVDVGGKQVTSRRAVATCNILMKPATRDAILAGTVPKGDVLAAARIAGIMAAKRTAELIPLCHPLPISSVTVEIEPIASDVKARETGLAISAMVATTARTGVEMEALTAASIAALTIYDMCKALDRAMRIDGLRVVEKSGGRSGDFKEE